MRSSKTRAQHRGSTILCRATDHIREQSVYRRHRENGFTYRTSDGIYDTSGQPDYGYLARLTRRARGRQARNHDRLCALEVLAAGQHRWNGSPWGSGFPGWHIECSAMAQVPGDFRHPLRRRGHIPVHHTNEIAQTQERVGTRLANFWMHGYFLLANDAKMAKSAGEFLRLKSLTDRGYDPLAYRYLCLTAHYRSQLNFTFDALDAAATALDRMRNGFHAFAERSRRPRYRAVYRRDQRRSQPATCARAGVGSAADELPPAVRKATLASLTASRAGARDMAAQTETILGSLRALAAARAAARAAREWGETDRLRLEKDAAGWGWSAGGRRPCRSRDEARRIRKGIAAPGHRACAQPGLRRRS
jgi:cysteinyl-tRNA synthetase